MTTSEFISKASIIHSNKYNYSLIEKDVCLSSSKAKIICGVHGEFLQTIKDHLNGHGCNKCGYEKMAKGQLFDINKFIKRSNEVHCNYYDYSISNYINSKAKINIICTEHGVFSQIASDHMGGRGCPKCGYKNRLTFGAGFNKHAYIKRCGDRLANLYFLKCYNDDEQFVKIGITVNDINYRFGRKSRMPYKYDIFYILNTKPEAAWNLEKKFHKINKEYKYIPKIKFDGMNECFKINILEESNDTK